MSLPARRRGAGVPDLAQLLRRGDHRRRQAGLLLRRRARSSSWTPTPERTRWWARPPSLERWKVYQGGNLAGFERMTGFSGEKVLYVGDHIYGDILKSRKASLWRTCMVVQELEDEIRYTEGRREEISRLSEVELLRRPARRRGEPAQGASSTRWSGGWSGARRRRRTAGQRSRRSAGEAKAELERLRRALQSSHRHRRDAGARRRGGLQPLLGTALQGGAREQPLRRAGGAVRLPLHLAGQQPSPRLADAVPPRRTGADAARAGRAPRRASWRRWAARGRRRARGGAEHREPAAPGRRLPGWRATLART